MSKINELRTRRAKAWEQTKAFLDSHRSDKGILSAEDTQTYERMEQEIVDLGHEIERQERLDAMEREMAAPVSAPITSKPDNSKSDIKTGRASDAYKTAFWNQIRSKNMMTPELKNALQEGVDSEGGYLVPDEYEHTLVMGLEGANVIRAHAHAFTTSNGVHKIPVVASKGTASWIDEEGAYTESDDVFGQEQIDAHKLGTIIKVSEELITDSVFDLEQYFTVEFARRIGSKEEEAFLVGNGVKKPTGLLNETGGAQLGVTAASATAITADELIDLYYSLKSPYRKNAIWILNDSTIKAIRKLKDGSGQYLWQPAIKDGEVNTILGKPYFTSSYAPEIGSAAKSILFGDLNFYWIGDRQGITFKRLNEKYADMGQIGFLASKRVDAKLILPEAVKYLQQKA
ncbi:MAG: phage major capsid protein [Oscillospiraceae bacterium]|nr:phage major capsid protein [Oscillospiraceae bacterium]MDY6207774.1 phage major capsid protein [Oscillospiraceae bacterium]